MKALGDLVLFVGICYVISPLDGWRGWAAPCCVLVYGLYNYGTGKTSE